MKRALGLGLMALLLAECLALVGCFGGAATEVPLDGTAWHWNGVATFNRIGGEGTLDVGSCAIHFGGPTETGVHPAETTGDVHVDILINGEDRAGDGTYTQNGNNVTFTVTPLNFVAGLGVLGSGLQPMGPNPPHVTMDLTLVDGQLIGTMEVHYTNDYLGNPVVFEEGGLH
jgi:hypothetical protein